MDATCPPCNLGLHEECYTEITNEVGEVNEEQCCCSLHDREGPSTLDSNDGTRVATGSSLREAILQGATATRTRKLKDDEDVKDQNTVGRKRAARMYPVEDGMVCEWANLRYAGGGAIPLVGCEGNILQAVKGRHAIHHGPDKSTLNNDQGNVHRICVSCHNRWHTLNDPLYGDRPDAGAPFLPLSGDAHSHDADTRADEKDFTFNKTYWSTPKKERSLTGYKSYLDSRRDEERDNV